MKKGLLFSASILALGVSPSFAQTAGSVSKAAAPQAVDYAEINQNSNNNIFRLGEIAVSVVDDTTQVGSRTTVTAEEISAYTDSNTLEKALNLLPSVTETQVGRRNEKSVSIRGFEMRQIAVMVDGVQSAMPYDYYPDLQTYTTGSLSKIQVSKGLSSVLAGPNTMGGIINMVTKRPEKAIEGNLTVTAKFGNSGAYNGILTSGNVGTNQGGWYLQAGATYNDINRWSVSDKYKPTYNTPGCRGGACTEKVNENGGFRDGSSSQAEAANIKLGFTPNETDEYVIAYSYSNMEYDIPVYAGESIVNPGFSFQLTKPFHRSYPYYKKQTVYSLTNTALGDTGYVKTRLFYDTFKNRMDSWEYTNLALTTTGSESGFPSLFNDYDFGGSVETGADLIKDNTTKIAFHYRKDVHRSKELLSNNDWARNVDDTYSVALENTWHTNDKTD
ncbi:MAG: TonB-dependent receptor plug domain-containing protein, partial [Alphaproteobacteria bacterium]